MAERNAVSANAHPTHDPAGVSHNQRKIRNISGHHGTRADESVLAYGYSAHDRAVRAESRSFTYQSRSQFVHPPDLAARIEYVRKHHRGTAEYVILKGHAVIDGDIILDFDSVADGNIRANNDILPDPAILADARVLQDMRHMPYARTIADLYIGVNERRLVREI
jgi:hypothetical protein